MTFPWRRRPQDYDLPSEDRIDEMVDDAKHASVTREALTETRRSRYLRSDTGWVHERPLVSYLHSDEQPHFVLESTQPVEVSRDESTELIEPVPPYRSLACITDRRIVLIVGKKPENWVATVRFEDLEDFGLKPGQDDPKKAEDVDVSSPFTPTLRLKADSVSYSFIGETSITLPYVRTLGGLIKSKFSGDRWEYEAFWKSAAGVRKEKQKERVERKRRREQEREARDRSERLRKEALERERREQLEALAEGASSTSVTPERLEPIVDHLYEHETVDFILWGGKRGFFVFAPDGEIEVAEIRNQDWTAITSQRILFSSGSGPNQVFYENLDTARIGSFPKRLTEERDTESDFPALILTGGEFVYSFEASRFVFPHLQDLVETVRGYVEDSQPA